MAKVARHQVYAKDIAKVQNWQSRKFTILIFRSHCACQASNRHLFIAVDEQMLALHVYVATESVKKLI